MNDKWAPLRQGFGGQASLGKGVGLGVIGGGVGTGGLGAGVSIASFGADGASLRISSGETVLVFHIGLISLIGWRVGNGSGLEACNFCLFLC